MKDKIKSKLAIMVLVIVVILLSVIYTNNNSQNLQVNSKYNDINIDLNKLNIFYFNVGQADCTLITINNKNMLIDAGQDSDGEYIVEFLKDRNIEQLDYFVITHGDIDHSGGAKDIINNIKIERIFMPQGISDCEEEYQEIRQLASKKEIEMPKIEVNQEFNLDVANFTIVSVKNDMDCATNDSSIAIRLNYFNTSYLFMGDITTDIEDEIKCESVDILKIGHHGSNSSTSTEFLEKIKPKYAIISAGNNKKYNHPSEEVLERLRNFGIQDNNIYITKNQGTIWITSNGENINIESREDINLDGTGQLSYRNIFYICSYFLGKNKESVVFSKK